MNPPDRLREMALAFLRKRIPSSFRDEKELLDMTERGKSSTYDSYLEGHAAGLKEGLEALDKISNGRAWVNANPDSVVEFAREAIEKWNVPTKGPECSEFGTAINPSDSPCAGDRD